MKLNLGNTLYGQLLSESILPKDVLTEKGRKWYVLGFISHIALIIAWTGYIYFGNQDWVCKLGPEKSALEAFKDIIQ